MLNFKKKINLLSFFHFQFLPSVCQSKHANLAVRPSRSSRDDVRQKHRQTAIVVNPPNIDGSFRLFFVEEIHRFENVLVDRCAASCCVINFVEGDLLLLVRQRSFIDERSLKSPIIISTKTMKQKLYWPISTAIVPGCGVVIELELDDPSPSRFKFESICMSFKGLIDNVKSSVDLPNDFIEWLCVIPLYCGKNSEKSTPLGILKIATAMRQSKALLKLRVWIMTSFLIAKLTAKPWNKFQLRCSDTIASPTCSPSAQHLAKAFRIHTIGSRTLRRSQSQRCQLYCRML